MGLYDDRLAALSESRPARNAAAQRRRFNPGSGAWMGASRKATSVQSLLFSKSEGWTPSKARSWAADHGYRHSKVDVTDQYIRLRQADPSHFKLKRTVQFGRGIRAVVAREGKNMALAKEASRKKKKSSRKAPRRRKASKTKRKAARRHARETNVSEKRRRRTAKRRRRVTREAWRGDSAGHAKAARKGWRRKKAAKRAAPRRRRRAAEPTIVATSRRRRRRSSHMMESQTVASSRRRRRRGHGRRMFASRGGGGLGAAELLTAAISGGIGFVLADGLDRFLATYDPTATERPKDKFTSDGAGTLANTLNVAAPPDWKRFAAAGAMTVAPAIGSMYTRGMVKSSLEGITLGAGINLFKLVWNNVLMPMFIGKDTSNAALQKSYIARLYPAEVAAHINMNQATPQTAVSSAGAGALSGPADVGPFALGGDSPYPDAAQALRREAGMSGPSNYPTIQNTWGTGGDSPYPTAAQALRQAAGVSDGPGVGAWEPGPASTPGPGPQPEGTDSSCGCIGASDMYTGLGEPADETPYFIPMSN